MAVPLCILIIMTVKSSFYNEYDIKSNEKMCRGLSVVYKITTRRSKIDVRKKWVGGPQRQMEQTGELSHFSQFWAGGGVGSRLRTKTERIFLLLDLQENWINYEYT